jgi:hypothetical protein
MPRLDENTQEYLQDAERGVRRHTSWAWDSFSNFALRDNVLEVAVGLMLMHQPPSKYISDDNTVSQQHLPHAPTPSFQTSYYQ